MSLAFTKDSVNRTYNVSQNYSITDITLLCDMRRQQNYCKYDYSYTLHSNVAKGSSDLEFKVLMSNKASLFFFKYDYNIAFNYADTFLFIDTWYYSEAKLGVVSVYYPDIKTGKK